MSINLKRITITEESSESENECEPAKIYHRRLSTKNINNSVCEINNFIFDGMIQICLYSEKKNDQKKLTTRTLYFQNLLQNKQTLFLL